MGQYTFKRPLAADTIVVLVLVRLIKLIIFVDSDIGQMHTQIIDVLIVGLLVWNSSETSQAVLVYIDTRRVHADHDGVDSEIIF